MGRACGDLWLIETLLFINGIWHGLAREALGLKILVLRLVRPWVARPRESFEASYDHSVSVDVLI